MRDLLKFLKSATEVLTTAAAVLAAAVVSPAVVPAADLSAAFLGELRRGGLEVEPGLRVRRRGHLQRPRVDRQPVELRRGPRRPGRRLERRRRLLTQVAR